MPTLGTMPGREGQTWIFFDHGGGLADPLAVDHGSHQGSLEYSYLAYTLCLNLLERTCFPSGGLGQPYIRVL